jgi:hypothetical protein
MNKIRILCVIRTFCEWQFRVTNKLKLSSTTTTATTTNITATTITDTTATTTTTTAATTAT